MKHSAGKVTKQIFGILLAVALAVTSLPTSALQVSAVEKTEAQLSVNALDNETENAAVDNDKEALEAELSIDDVEEESESGGDTTSQKKSDSSKDEGDSSVDSAEISVQSTTEYTFYYYCEDTLAPAVQMAGSSGDGGKYFGYFTADSEYQDSTYTYTDSESSEVTYYYQMKSVGGSENWWQIKFTFNDSAGWGQFSLYRVLEGEISEGTVLKSWLSTEAFAQKDKTGDFTNALADGKCYYKDGSYYASIEASEAGHTLADLKTLYNTAAELEESDYTEDSWSTLSTAMATAKSLIDADSTSSEDIEAAYTALNNAINALQQLPVTATLYYYYGETGKTLGVVEWQDSKITYADGTGTASDDWTLGEGWTAKPALMTESETYAGWYSITINFDKTSSNIGFEIHPSDDAKNAVFTCSQWNYKSIYEALLSGEENSYAVKNGVCYAGDDAIKQIMRNITLYVYSASGTPAIKTADNKASLCYVDETADSDTLGTKQDLTAEEVQDGDYTYYYYSMTPDEKEGWYYLQFIVPEGGSDETSGNAVKILELYNKTTSGYAWVKNFLDGSKGADEWSVDFTQVFQGNIYYKDGVFSASRDANLGELKELIDEAQEKADAGQGGYSESSWSALTTALAAAKKLYEKLHTTNSKPDNYTDADVGEGEEAPGITDAYTTLQEALDGLKIEVTMWYYYGDTSVTDLGFTLWGKNISSSSSTATWSAYGSSSNDTTYAMTKDETYPGWYSAKLSFTDDGAESGLNIHTYNSETQTVGQEQDKITAAYSNKEVYAELAKGAESEYAVKASLCYAGADLVKALKRNATLYFYSKDGAAAIGTAEGTTLSYVDSDSRTLQTLTKTATADSVDYYDLAEDTEKDWYTVQLSIPEDTAWGLYKKTSSGAYELVANFVSGTTSGENDVDYTDVFSGKVYYKNKEFLSTRPKALDDLIELVEKANQKVTAQKTEKVYEEDEQWEKFTGYITAAQTLIDGDAAAQTDEAIQTAYDNLKAAMEALNTIKKESSEINVERVAVDDDFITGADLSSYVSLKESGVVFKDENGKALSDDEFFAKLAAGGTNWVRIRVWNDPYDQNGNGYGGGNNDLDKAITIGQLATKAGMKVLIDFHYSDFWADPSKQDAPKAWKNLSVDEKVKQVYDYTYSSLQTLEENGVAVSMVQVGNETNNGICGETEWTNMAKIFNAGSKAVRAYAAEYNHTCKVAVHFADPDKGFSSIAAALKQNNVDYDVFASSYYPYWHEGDTDKGKAGHYTDNLVSQLKYVAQTYGKEVMVAETSWVTTWEDGDGHENTAPKTSGQTLDYNVSLQGQANEIRDVMAAVQSVNNTVEGAGIGMFYWEPAWISANYVYNADGTIDQSLYEKNKQLWEKYGSGWASSYSVEYDPTDAGLWYGGSAIDNQAWFDFDGKMLDTANIYSYIRAGASRKDGKGVTVDSVDATLVKEITVGTDLDTALTSVTNSVTVRLSDGTKKTNADTDVTVEITWDPDEKELISTDKKGNYSLDGKLTCTYTPENGDQDTYEKDVVLSLTVVAAESSLLTNPGFENYDSGNSKHTGWDSEGVTAFISTEAKDRIDTAHSGTYGAHFYFDASKGDNGTGFFTLQQTVSDLAAGTYTFGGYIQGGDAGDYDVQEIFVQVTDTSGNKTEYKKTWSLSGWQNWVNPEITGIKVSEGDSLLVGVKITSTEAAAWGTIDDMYLYGNYDITKDFDETQGTLSVSNLDAAAGEVITVTATPKSGYLLDTLEITGGSSVTNSIVTSNANGTLGDVEAGKVTITYAEQDGTQKAAFLMPGCDVTIKATFTSLFGKDKIDISKNENIKVTVGSSTYSVGNDVVIADQKYTGKQIIPDFDISYLGYKLTSSDYKVSGKNNVGDGKTTSKATLTVTGQGSRFTGKFDITFNVIPDSRTSLSDKNVTVTFVKPVDASKKTAEYYYDLGKEVEPDVEIKIGSERTLTSDDYTLYYQNNKKLGTATVVVVAKDDSLYCKGSVSKTFKIIKCDIEKTEQQDKANAGLGLYVSATVGGTYTGSKVTPNVTVKYKNQVLQKGKDYTVSYKNNTNAYTDTEYKTKNAPTIVITGKGNYSGKIEKHFTIECKSITDTSVTVVADALAYNKNKELTPKLTVKNGNKTLNLNSQYEISKIVAADETIIYNKYYEGDADKGSSAKAVVKKNGTYTVTIKGLKNYKDEREVKLYVLDEGHQINKATISLQKNAKLYADESRSVAAAKIAVSINGKTLDSSAYEIQTYTTNAKSRKATVVITGKTAKGYAGTKTATLTLTAREVKAAPSGTVSEPTSTMNNDTVYLAYAFTTNAEFTTERPYTGYAQTPELEIYAATGKTINAYADKTVTVATAIQKAGKQLTQSVDYTIKYSDNTNVSKKDNKGNLKGATVTVSTKSGYKGSVKFTNVFTIKDVTLNDFIVSVDTATYSGKAVKPTIHFIYKETGKELELKAGTAYTVSYKNNTKNATRQTVDASSAKSTKTPYLVITEKGLNTNSKSKAVQYFGFTITTGTITAADVSEIKGQTYSNKAVQPTVTVKVNGRTLKANTDYVVTYTNNKGAGKATATITGIGSYSGTVTKTFVIK